MWAFCVYTINLALVGRMDWTRERKSTSLEVGTYNGP